MRGTCDFTVQPTIAFMRFYCILVPVSLLATTVTGAQSADPTSTPLDGVAVSRRALTISILLETSAATATKDESKSGWTVTVMQEVLSHSSRLSLAFREPIDVSAYRSAHHPTSCRVLTDAYSCSDSSTATIANGRLLITVRDSAMLALLFADRPTHVSVHTSIRQLRLGRVAVRYVDRQLLPPSKDALAEYDRALGRKRLVTMDANAVGRKVLGNRYRLAAGRRAADGRSARGAGPWHRLPELAFGLHRIGLDVVRFVGCRNRAIQ
jgi:hypothetical protein